MRGVPIVYKDKRSQPVKTDFEFNVSCNVQGGAIAI